MSKSYVPLTPSVERRLSAWISLGEKGGGRGPREPRPTITLSRRFGCEAYPLSEHLKNLLDERTGETWTIFDKALLERVAQDEQLSMALLQDLGGPSRAIDSIGFLVPGYRPHSEVFRHIPKYILRIAEVGNAIIVGRGAAIVTHDLPNCYHFRLEADVGFRVASMARRLGITETEAKKVVREGEKTRDHFVDECLHASAADPSWYDAVFNNARHDVEGIARSITSYVLHAWATRSRTGQQAITA
jgi:cytidylate kinase